MLKTRVALIVPAILAAGCLFGGKDTSYNTPYGASNVEQLVNEIASGSFEVAARNFKPFKVVVPPGVDHAWIEGTFTAKGGSGDDIEVTLLDEIQFLNWQNRHKFMPLYESGRLTSDRIKITLPPDPATYVMVFSNRFSLLTTKGVVADVKLRYDPPKK